MKVLHLLAPAPFGGLERVVEMLVRGQLEIGLDVQVAVILEPGARSAVVDALIEAGASVHEVVVPTRSYLQERRAVAELYRAVGPDLVHLHGYRPDVLHRGAAARLRIPQMTTVHGFTGGDLKNRFYQWLQHHSFRRMDAVVAVSEPLVRELSADGVPKDRLHCVVNAWHRSEPPLPRGAAREALSLPAEGFRVGFIGRLGTEKGPDLLLEALARVPDLPVKVSLVGAGREEATLREAAARLGVTDRMRFHGMVSRAGQLLKAFDLLAISSRTEGTPIVLFEAMEAEVPVVAAAVGGIPNVVSGDEALLVPPEDPKRLAEAIRAVFEDPDAAAARACRARARLTAKYGVEAWVGQYESIYRQVARGRGGRCES